MVERPERPELVGLLGVGVGFVAFTFGVLAAVAGRQDPVTLGLVVVGAAVGVSAAGYLVVHYSVVEIVEA